MSVFGKDGHSQAGRIMTGMPQKKTYGQDQDGPEGPSQEKIVLSRYLASGYREAVSRLRRWCHRNGHGLGGHCLHHITCLQFLEVMFEM
jgi:hypothetical protein